jgi:hypothetical protein
MTQKQIERLLRRPTISPRELYESKMLPLSLQSIYEAIRKGEIAAGRIGRKVLIYTGPLRRRMQIDPE